MFTIEQIIEATRGKLINGQPKGLVRSVSIDSRQVIKGQVFIAIKGDIFDGHDFVLDVIAKGVGIVLVHKPIAVVSPRVIVILVKDTARALGDLARFHRLRFKTPVIAITGSAGKTTTKEMIAAILASKYKVLKNEGTQNNHIGVPMTLLKLKSMHKVVVLECGTNQPGDIPWLADIARPDAVVFTNIGESHLEKLKTPVGVLKEKWALTAFMRKGSTVILNGDEILLAKQGKAASKTLKIVSFSLKQGAALIASRVVIQGGRSLCFTALGKRFELNTCGVSHIYNALAAIACGQMLRVPVDAMVKALKKFEFPSGRGQIIKLGKGWLINDVYNANPVSMRSALQTLDALYVDGKKIFVAADMLELGARAKDLHQSIGRSTGDSTTQVLITLGSFSKHMALAAKQRNKDLQTMVCQDIEGVQQSLASVFCNGDAVLVKGSRRMKMEQVVDFLLSSPQAAIN